MSMDDGMPSHDCGQSNISDQGCSGHQCSDAGCLPSAMAAPGAFVLKTSLPIREKVTHLDYTLVGKATYPPYRPPRV